MYHYSFFRVNTTLKARHMSVHTRQNPVNNQNCSTRLSSRQKTIRQYKYETLSTTDNNLKRQHSTRKRALGREENEEDSIRRSKRITTKAKVEAEILTDKELPPIKNTRGTKLTAAEQLRSKKIASQVQYQNKTPFPDFIHPTATECKLAYKILSSLHGPRIRPKEVIAPKTQAGCGNSPSVLDALVRTILSQNTSSTNSTRAKRNMDLVYGSSHNWEAIINGGQNKLQETIKCGGLSSVKSRVILSILNQVYTRYGIYSLDHLHAKSNDEAMQEMLSFKGVGPKTASCVLLFCLQRASFAVDTHVWRITGLLGWRPASAGRDETFRHLEVRIPDEDKYGLHILLITHGKKCLECRAGGKFKGECELRMALSHQEVKKEQDREVKTKMTNDKYDDDKGIELMKDEVKDENTEMTPKVDVKEEILS